MKKDEKKPLTAAQAAREQFLLAWTYAANHSEKCAEGYNKKAFRHVQFWLDTFTKSSGGEG